MAKKKSKVFMAFSGGVDSSAATGMLIEQGYECEGVYMVTCEEFEKSKGHAVELADRLGIRLHILDYRGRFEKILDYFADEYRHARTPNPCVMCNRYFKFGELFEYSMSQGADYFATGHYVQVHKGAEGYGLYEAVNKSKDQSYALCMIDKAVLDRIIFPLGELTKEETVEKSKELGLHIENREESQDICFIPDDDYISVLEERCPELVRKGEIVDTSGNKLGEHDGVHKYTIGQRRGLRVAMGEPYYVVELDAENNRVVLGVKDNVLRDELRACDVNWLIDEPTDEFNARVKIRYNNRGAEAVVKRCEFGVEVKFIEKVFAITPGQLAVFYVSDDFGEKAVGSGWIMR